ncbi:hypothetical protein R3P38DRAFT_3611890 [Favolaschia claudopus]|uniref:Ribosomal protein L5 n=1 Tax=Favolaschia claudopus TaxID=2862362 RepID=A0AAW0A5P3_9AGAR
MTKFDHFFSFLHREFGRRQASPRPPNSHRNINITSPPSALLHRGFCCQQANPSSRLQAAASPRASRALRLVDDAPRSGAYSFEYLESLPKFRRAASSALFHQGFCCRQAKAALHTQTNELVEDAPRVALSIQNLFPRAGSQPPSRLKVAAFHVPRELFGSSTTRRAAARSFEYIEFFPASGTLRILPPAGKNHPPDFKQRLSHESLELCSSMTTRRAAACSFEYTDFVPASGGLSAFAPRTLPPAGKSRSSKLKAALSRATISSGERPLRFRISNIRTSRIPDIFGIRVFAVRRVKLAKGTNQSSVSRPPPAPFLKANIKIGNSRFRRPPTADFVREVVQFSDSSFRVPMNLNFNIVRFEA